MYNCIGVKQKCFTPCGEPRILSQCRCGAVNDKAELALLLDYYGAFLTERQRELARMSSDEDMSLAEIAEQAGVSRQAVRDSLAKASRQLHGFEEKLGLLERDKKLMAISQELMSAAEFTGIDDIKAAAAKAAEKLSALVRQ